MIFVRVTGQYLYAYLITPVVFWVNWIELLWLLLWFAHDTVVFWVPDCNVTPKPDNADCCSVVSGDHNLLWLFSSLKTSATSPIRPLEGAETLIRLTAYIFHWYSDVFTLLFLSCVFIISWGGNSVCNFNLHLNLQKNAQWSDLIWQLHCVVCLLVSPITFMYSADSWINRFMIRIIIWLS